MPQVGRKMPRAEKEDQNRFHWRSSGWQLAQLGFECKSQSAEQKLPKNRAIRISCWKLWPKTRANGGFPPPPPNFHISPATFPSWNIKRHAAAPAATTSQLTALVRKTGLTNPCCQIDSKSTQRGADKPVSQPASHLYLYNPPWHPSNPSHCAQRKNIACLKNVSIEMQS